MKHERLTIYLFMYILGKPTAIHFFLLHFQMQRKRILL